ERFDERTRQAREVEIWPEVTIGTPSGELKYRFNWTFPLALSPHDHNTVYAGSQHVHRTTNGGQSWQEISPDLTLNDKSHQTISGGLTPDNIGVEYAGVVFAIAESPLEKGLIWAGTNDGQVQVTRNAGGQWTNVTANLPGLPPLGTVSNLEPSRFDPGTAYVTVDLHQVNNRDPFVYKTTDYGRTWKSITGDLPKSVHSYAHCLREDPVRKGMLYLGTENALYFSMDDGLHWLPLQSGLPHAPVHWMTIQERFNDLVVATYGRGFYILDDITTLRQLTPETASAMAHLFAPRAAYRFRPITDPMMMPDDPTAGKNPPDGAPISFSLKSAPAKDEGGKVNEDAVTLSISDASGQVVRTMKVAKNAEAGVNRVWWDLRGDPSKDFTLRTSPLYAPEFKVGPDGTRKLPTAAPLSVLVRPGPYTVKLMVNGQGVGSPQMLVVKKDPNTSGTEADIEAQTKLMLEIRDNMNAAADLINQTEVARARLAQQQELAENDEAGKGIKAKASDLDKKIVALESRLFNMTVTGRGQDQLRLPSQIVEKLAHLADIVSLNDFAPTDQALLVHKKLSQELSEIREQIKPLLAVDR
ncbi:MAG: sialidase, partial [Vicinamibacteria bacterium]